MISATLTRKHLIEEAHIQFQRFSRYHHGGEREGMQVNIVLEC